MQVTGKITKVMEAVSGTSAAGKEWKKISFLLETTEEYNNLYCFEIFGEEKVDEFLRFNKVGQMVDVKFNVKTNEWKDKYFTSLQAWSIFKAEDLTTVPPPMEEQISDLPFD
tara:strand:- start:1255 stop:1590 length:336 start_codon:yes stop_codon:yes gene_type:complete